MGEESTAEWELKARLADFTTGFRSLTAALDPQAGWYAAFARRAGEELNEWLAGRMLPPWDAVADLLQDLAALRGRAAAERTGWRLRERYEAATLALDTLPGARETLTRRLAELEHAEREAGDR